MKQNLQTAQTQMGAHELMELHEVLTDAINGINQFQLYTPHCRDQELQQTLQNQIHFMIEEYNTMVNIVASRTNNQNIATYQKINSNPSTNNQMMSTDNSMSEIQINDHDIASSILGCAKTSAILRMHATLECSDPELRNMMIQGAKNCSDQAYETWSYMNKKGYYQVPTFSTDITSQIANHYQPTNENQ